MLHRSAYLVLCWLFLFNGSVGAQSAAQTKRTCRVVFFQAPTNAPKSLYLFDGQNCQEVELPRRSFSKVYELPQGDVTLRLLAQSIATPEEVPADAPALRIPAGMSDFYLLVTHQPSQAVVPVALQAVDASNNLFKKGQMLWFNLTEHDVGGQLGEGKFVVKSRTRQVTPEPRSDAGGYLVELFYALEGDARPHPIARTQWNHDPESRMVVFIYKQEGRRAPHVAGILDYREPKTKE